MNRERINKILQNHDKERTLVNKELDKFKKPKDRVWYGLLGGFIIASGYFNQGGLSEFIKQYF